jgi:hypothetical protein
MNIGDKVLYEGIKLTNQFVIPKWLTGKTWGHIIYIGELYIGVELVNPKRFFDTHPDIKQKFAEAGVKEPWVIGLNEEQQKICLTFPKVKV